MSSDQTLFPSRAAAEPSEPSIARAVSSRSRRLLRRLLLWVLTLTTAAFALAAFNVVGRVTLGNELGAHLAVSMHGILLALELAMLWVSRRRAIADRSALDVAVVWQVLVCLTLSFFQPWISWVEQGVIPRMTWASLVIVIAPFVLANTPRLTAVASLLSAATIPVGLVLLHVTGHIAIAPRDVVAAAVSPALALGASLLGSRVVFGLHKELAHTRVAGSYVLEQLLGRGGMGEVWRGSHRLLARPAAIKLIRPDRAGRPDARELELARFHREANVTATLRSPHTVELYDFGVTDAGDYFYVMELLDGLDLDTLVQCHGPQPAARVAYLLTQACHSLAEAHQRGLIHRDVKPANLFLCRQGRDLDVLKVLDFGLVALDSPARRCTGAPTDVAGTPSFLAPELISDPDGADARADLYALGCVAFWLLTGRPPFVGDQAQVLRDHLTRPAPAPSQVANVAVAPDLEALILRCLAKQPDARPRDAAELGDVLASLPCAQAWDGDARRTWWRAHRPVTAAGIAGGPTRTLP